MSSTLYYKQSKFARHARISIGFKKRKTRKGFSSLSPVMKTGLTGGVADFSALNLSAFVRDHSLRQKDSGQKNLGRANVSFGCRPKAAPCSPCLCVQF